MDQLPTLQSRLKNALPTEGISPVIKSLKEALPEDSPKYNLVLQLEAEYRDVKLQMLEGTLEEDDLLRFNNSLRKRLLELIDSLEPADFDRTARRSRLAPEQQVRLGHVLYRIPQTMRIGEESRCLVRIAFDKAMLVEDLDLDKDTELRSDVRLSDYMRVELIDPGAEAAFAIRTTSEPIQFIDQDDFTEWRFYVSPLLAGEHVLELKVCLMLVINGTEKVREKTLEESVVVIAEGAAESVEEPAGFRHLDDDGLVMPASVRFIAPRRTNVMAVIARVGTAAVIVGLGIWMVIGYYLPATREQVTEPTDVAASPGDEPGEEEPVVADTLRQDTLKQDTSGH